SARRHEGTDGRRWSCDPERSGIRHTDRGSHRAGWLGVGEGDGRVGRSSRAWLPSRGRERTPERASGLCGAVPATCWPSKGENQRAEDRPKGPTPHNPEAGIIATDGLPPEAQPPGVFESEILGTCHELTPGLEGWNQPNSVAAVARLVLPCAYLSDGDLFAPG